MADKKSGIFTEDEVASLNKVQNIRHMIIDQLTAQGIPVDVKEITTLRETLKDVDSAVMSSANIRLKHVETQDNETLKNEMIQLLRMARGPVSPRDTSIMVPSSIIPTDAVEGEMELSNGGIVVETVIANDGEE